MVSEAPPVEVENAACATWKRLSTGLLGSDAAATPRGVQERLLVLAEGMAETC